MVLEITTSDKIHGKSHGKLSTLIWGKKKKLSPLKVLLHIYKQFLEARSAAHVRARMQWSFKGPQEDRLLWSPNLGFSPEIARGHVAAI